MSGIYLLLPTLILLIVPVVMLVLRAIRPRFVNYWLVAALGALVVLPLVLFGRTLLPMETQLSAWQATNWLPAGPLLILDEHNWPYALALSFLIAALILTEISRAEQSDWKTWAGCLILTAFGLTGVLAGNLTAVVISWAALDSVELILLLIDTRENEARERILAGFLVRAAALFFIMYAALLNPGSARLQQEAIFLTDANWVLILAAGLRLSTLLLHLPFLKNPQVHRSLGTMVRLTSLAAPLALLARTAEGGVPHHLATPLLIVSGLAGLLGAGAWLLATNELEGRPFWLLGMAALSFASAVRGSPEASIAWGTAAILSGGLIFLFSIRHRNLLPILLFGLFNVSGLPFSPSWPGLFLYEAPFSILAIVFILVQGLLLAGYIRQALRPGDSLGGAERWVFLIYPLGLLLLPLAHFLGFLWLRPLLPTPGLGQTWLSLIALSVGALSLALIHRSFRIPPDVAASFQNAASLAWSYRVLSVFYRAVGRLLSLISEVLEGEGGLLWTLLLLTILISWLMGNPVGN